MIRTQSKSTYQKVYFHNIHGQDFIWGFVIVIPQCTNTKYHICKDLSFVNIFFFKA